MQAGGAGLSSRGKFLICQRTVRGLNKRTDFQNELPTFHGNEGNGIGHSLDFRRRRYWRRQPWGENLLKVHRTDFPRQPLLAHGSGFLFFHAPGCQRLANQNQNKPTNEYDNNQRTDNDTASRRQ
jgi:hypothetical protein